MALWDDDGDLKILAMQSNPQKKVLGEKLLIFLKKRALSGDQSRLDQKQKSFGKKCVQKD
jgi:hypothetical protein